ncbi:MAG: hypothetical protein R3C97_14150 [Geminicoccaceae bacterium]
MFLDLRGSFGQFPVFLAHSGEMIQMLEKLNRLNFVVAELSNVTPTY